MLKRESRELQPVFGVSRAAGPVASFKTTRLKRGGPSKARDRRESFFFMGIVLIVLYMSNLVFGWTYIAIAPYLPDMLQGLAIFPAGLVALFGGIALTCLVIVSFILDCGAAVICACFALHWTVYIALAAYGLIAYGSSRLSRTFSGASVQNFKTKLAAGMSTVIKDTAINCEAGVLLVLAFQALVILLSQFKGDSALIWTLLAPLFKLKAVPLLWSGAILAALVALTAVWPSIPFVSRAQRLFKWYKRTKTATFVACSFCVTAAVAGSGTATQYALRLGPDKLSPVPITSLAAREAAAGYIEWCLRTLTPTQRHDLVLAMIHIEKSAAPEARMRSAADDFAYATVVDSQSPPAAQSKVDSKPNPPTAEKEVNQSATVYKQAREAAVSILSDAAKQAAKSVGVAANDPFIGQFVDAVISAVAKTSFDRAIPMDFADLAGLQAWAGQQRREPIRTDGIQPDIRLKYFREDAVAFPDVSALPVSIGHWVKEVGPKGGSTEPDAGPKGIGPIEAPIEPKRPKLPELPEVIP